MSDDTTPADAAGDTVEQLREQLDQANATIAELREQLDGDGDQPATPAPSVEQLQRQLADARAELERLRAQLDAPDVDDLEGDGDVAEPDGLDTLRQAGLPV